MTSILSDEEVDALLNVGYDDVYDDYVEPIVILVSGFKRAGKDTLAGMLTNALTAKGKSVEVMSFAEPMKQIASTILGISLNNLDDYKNNPTVFKLQVVNQVDQTIAYSTDCRTFLQKLGTEAIKPIFGNNVWAQLLYERVNNSTADYVIVPDFRFKVEHSYSAITIRIESNMAQSADAHISETELLHDFVFDYTLRNDDYSMTQSYVDSFVAEFLLQERP